MSISVQKATGRNLDDSSTLLSFSPAPAYHQSQLSNQRSKFEIEKLETLASRL